MSIHTWHDDDLAQVCDESDDLTLLREVWAEQDRRVRSFVRRFGS